MKFKTQEIENKEHPLFNDVLSVVSTIKEFAYAIYTYKTHLDNVKTQCYQGKLKDACELLLKLCTSLSSEHVYPNFTVEYTAVESIEDLVKLEETYYTKLKEVGTKALESNDIEVVSYISPLIADFKHYFCTLDETDDKR